jgi:Spy/CpxP family protein refolding chaperone
MKTLLYLTMGALLLCPILANAQSTNAAPSGPPPGPGDGGPTGRHHGFDFLTPDQQAELKKDHDAALAANPTLGTQLEQVHQQMKDAHENGQKPSEDLMKQAKDLQDQFDQAMIKIDPNVASIIEEIKKHHHGRGPGGGGPDGQASQGGRGAPPPPDGGN